MTPVPRWNELLGAVVAPLVFGQTLFPSYFLLGTAVGVGTRCFIQHYQEDPEAMKTARVISVLSAGWATFAFGLRLFPLTAASLGVVTYNLLPRGEEAFALLVSGSAGVGLGILIPVCGGLFAARRMYFLTQNLSSSSIRTRMTIVATVQAAFASL